MINPTLYNRIAPVARRIQWCRAFLTLSVVWVLCGVLASALWWWYSSQGEAWLVSVIGLLLVTLVGSCLGLWLALRGDDEFQRTAQRIELAFPELDSALVTALEQRPPKSHLSLGFLQTEVVRKAVYHGYQNSWRGVMPAWKTLIASFASFGSLVFLILALLAPFLFGLFEQRPDVIQFEAVAVTDAVGKLVVEPGNAEVERGSSLLVLARFDGGLPPEALLVVRDQDGTESSKPMTQSLDDPVFGGRIRSIEQPAEYFVRYGSHDSDIFQIGVFDFPKLQRADAELRFPDFTSLEDKVIQDVRRVSAVPGTELTLKFLVNKPLQSAELVSSDGTTIALQQSNSDKKVYQTTLAMTQSGKYKLHLLDSESRKNSSPPPISINVLPNQPPEIKLLQPSGDVQVSPLEEVSMAAEIWDDFGIHRAGFSYTLGTDPEQDVILGDSIDGKTRTRIDHLLEFEALNATADDLVTFYFWAEDLVTDGLPRRVASDMYFADVRSFEEIFRQGEQQANAGQPQQSGQGQSQNAQQAMELADLQKQIINATWTVIRRETGDSVTDAFSDDLDLLVESQSAAVQQLQSLAMQIQDEQSRQFVQQVRSHMDEAIELLTAAGLQQDTEILRTALTAERAAYQALLRLRAKEHQVAQQQQGQQGGQQASRSRQQMQQLQLKNDENRYENQKLAAAEEDPQQREDRQILSRLRELARRQNDLNKRIKELQSALEETETKEEEEEIRMRLQRLREEQQQILRDTEELQERFEQPENQSRNSDQAEQLEQARENVQRSSEALEQGEVSRAAAEGTRAERELKELRDEFQKRTSGQFNDRMRQMRNEARDIENEQQKISEQIVEMDESQTQRRRLTEPNQRDEVTNQLDQQQERVRQIRESIKQVIEEADEFEPILAEKLYDTYRKTEQESLEQALESTARSVDRGFVEDARREERRASRGIEQLRQGVDEAAAGVLGDETAALRRANRELQQLRREVEGEANRADPNELRQSESARAAPGSDQDVRDPDTDDDSQPSGQADATSENPDQPRDPGRANPATAEDDQPRQDSGQNPDRNQPARDGQPQDQTSDGPPQPSQGQPSQGQPSQGQPSSAEQQSSQQADSQQDGSGRSQRAADNSVNQRGANRPPSLRPDGRQDQRGARGADPEISNQEFEDWSAPLAGQDFIQWSDRLRDVEEMIADPEMRAEASRIRDAAKSIRREVRRHSKEPNWDLVRLKVIEPMVELQQRVSEELLRRSSNKSLVPIDRDPVPAEFQNAVEKYYEQIGRGQ